MSNLSKLHLLYIRDHYVGLPDGIDQQWRKISYLITHPDSLVSHQQNTVMLGSIPIISRLILNRSLHTLHQTQSINVIYAVGSEKTHALGRQIARRFGLPLIIEFAHSPEAAVALTAPVIGSIVHELEHRPIHSKTPAVVIPTFIAQSRYWRPAGYKQAITKCLVTIDQANQEQFQQIIDLVAGIGERHRGLECTFCLPESLTKHIQTSLPENCVLATLPSTTSEYAALIGDHQLVISCSSLEHALIETAVTIAAGIPFIALENQFTHLINQSQPVIESMALHPPHIFGTIAGILTHPEIAYQQAKNTQHWLKTNVSDTFLPTAWLAAVSWIITTAGFETTQSSPSVPDPDQPEADMKVPELP